MKELEIQKYLRIGNTLEKLKEEYGITNRSHKEFPNLILLKYSQIESDMSKRLVQECRGIILDSDNDYNVVSFPYMKFFNLEEGHAAKIEWNSARIYEKVDGSLITLFWYDEAWRCATSGSPDASGEVNGFNFSFKNLFWRVFHDFLYTAPPSKNIVYMFELCTKYNRVVIPYEKERLILHGARNMDTWEELTPEEAAKGTNWEVVKTYPFSTVEEVMHSLKDLPGIQSEGYVVCDKHFNRIKVKNASYVAIHQMKDGFSTKRMLGLIMANEGEEFLAYFPEWNDLYNEIKSKYDQFILDVSLKYEEVKNIEIQKDFALAIKDLEFKAVLFSMRKLKTSALEEISKMRLDSLFELLKIENIELGN